jgi:hypothetical protein
MVSGEWNKAERRNAPMERTSYALELKHEFFLLYSIRRPLLKT